MKTLLVTSALVLTAVSGYLYTCFHGSWPALLSCFAGMGTVVIGLTFNEHITVKAKEKRQVTYVPLLMALDTLTVMSWLQECFQFGLTDNELGRAEMAKAMCARIHHWDVHEDTRA